MLRRLNEKDKAQREREEREKVWHGRVFCCVTLGWHRHGALCAVDREHPP